VRCDVAMTEKSPVPGSSAHRRSERKAFGLPPNGLRTIVLPKDNEKDLGGHPQEILSSLTVH